MKATIASFSYGVGWQAVRHMPEASAQALFRVVADESWRRRGKGVQQLEENLQRVLPDAPPAELRELSRQAMRSYLRYWSETFRLPQWDAAEVEERMIVHNRDRIFEYRERGKGLIAVLGHFGNWDHCGAWAATVGLRLTTVAERLRPETLFDRFVSYREGLGMEVVPLTGGPNVADLLRERLVNNGFVCLLADRDLSERGVEVNLLGGVARFPAGPALLAARTGATLMPAISYYDDRRTHVVFLPEIVPKRELGLRDRVQGATQQFADIVGDAARAHPTDWHMLQRVWTDDLTTSR